MKITSVNNDLVKETAKLLQKKYREEMGLFLIEGEKGISEAIDAGIEIVRLFINENININCKAVVIETTDSVLSKISDAKSAPKCIAVAKQEKLNINELKTKNKVLLLEGIKDAGNLGTIIRSATAFNVDAIILYGNTIDLYNPKCVRATVGNLWKTPIFEIKDKTILDKYFAKYERIATLPKGENVCCLKEYKPSAKTLIMFGSEADGLSDELKNYATKNLTIEMSNKVESLNLATAVGIILYNMQ